MDAVFGEATVTALKRKYVNKPPSYQSDLYFVATSPDRAGLREWIEATMAGMPENAQRILTTRLRTDAGFLPALNELAVGEHLAATGRPLLYEEAFDGLTPDWWLPAMNGEAPAIVEVWTRTHPAGDGGRRRSWLGLREAVQRIPVPANLTVRPQRQGAPDRETTRRLARQVQEWLGEHPVANAKRDFEGYQFGFLGEHQGTAVRLATPDRGGAFGVDDVLSQIRAKVRRYEEAARTHSAAIAVIVGAEVGTAIDYQLVRHALTGKNSFMMELPELMEQPFAEATATMRHDESPPALSPLLSTVGFVNVRVTDDPAGGAINQLQIMERTSARFNGPQLAVPTETIP